jgi:hypothetical protein
MFTQVTEEVEEMACDSDKDDDIIENDTYHSVVKLGRGKKITKQCSPMLSWLRKGGDPQNLNDRLLCKHQGSGTP